MIGYFVVRKPKCQILAVRATQSDDRFAVIIFQYYNKSIIGK